MRQSFNNNFYQKNLTKNIVKMEKFSRVKQLKKTHKNREGFMGNKTKTVNIVATEFNVNSKMEYINPSLHIPLYINPSVNKVTTNIIQNGNISTSIQ